MVAQNTESQPEPNLNINASTNKTEPQPEPNSNINASTNKQDESVTQKTNSTINRAIERYDLTLKVLTESAPHASKQQILNVLVARDAVQAALTEEAVNSTENLEKIKQLDSRLTEQAEAMIQGDNLFDLCKSFKPPATAWWWFLDTPQNRWDRHDWLWNSLSVACLTASLSLVADIGPRFWAGGSPGTLGALAVIGPSVFSLLAGGGALTQAGRDAVEHMLTRLKIPKHFWQEVSCGASVLVLLGLVGFRLSLPHIANRYNQLGEEQHYQKEVEPEDFKPEKIASAEDNYKRAIALDPENALAHFNLGVIYENRQELDDARTQYKIAVQLGSVTARNNLARLYLLDDKASPATAVSLLLNGKRNAKTDEDKYYLYKNLGWARLKQKRYLEAKEALEGALALRSKVESKLNKKVVAANCLMAQVVEAKDEKQKPLFPSAKQRALSEWKICASANPSYPELDTWQYMAHKRINQRTRK